jgi:DNA (cytosine-5)-methyltransferase 1
MRAVDLFAGAGGFSTGAKMAGCEVVWAANHWPTAVEVHAKNHPDTLHACQDLHQANWAEVPDHDLLLASPCCQGHSKARGKASGNPQHDASRSTAWAPVAALEVHRPKVALIENVPEFLEWALYPAWKMAVEALGYSVGVHVEDTADHGVPQNRERMILVLTKSRAPIQLRLEKEEHIPASTFVDFDGGSWTPVNKPGRAQATLERIAAGRRQFGERFIMPYYGSGSGLTGRSLDRPVGTITTKNRWGVVDGDRMRMFTAAESRAAMSFPDDYILTGGVTLDTHLLGNAVPPKFAQKVINALRAQH